MLESFGLDATETAVYQALLRNPGRRPAGLGLDPADLERALGTLKRRALVRPGWSDPGTLRAVAPDAGLRLLLEEQEAELSERRRMLERARATLAEIVAEYATARSGGDVAEHVAGRHDGLSRLEEVCLSARTEVCWLSLGSGGPDALDDFREADLRLLERGVRLRRVYPVSVRHNTDLLRHARRLAGEGAQVRTRPGLAQWLLLVDGETAVVPADPELPCDGIVVLRARGVVLPPAEQFAATWDAAAPLEEATGAATDPAEPDPVERATLRMLAEGLTDEAVARRLNVSRRTVRRQVAKIMDALGTRSRFEAGVRAVQRGWL